MGVRDDVEYEDERGVARGVARRAEDEENEWRRADATANDTAAAGPR